MRHPSIMTHVFFHHLHCRPPTICLLSYIWQLPYITVFAGSECVMFALLFANSIPNYVYSTSSVIQYIGIRWWIHKTHLVCMINAFAFSGKSVLAPQIIGYSTVGSTAGSGEHRSKYRSALLSLQTTVTRSDICSDAAGIVKWSENWNS